MVKIDFLYKTQNAQIKEKTKENIRFTLKSKINVYLLKSIINKIKMSIIDWKAIFKHTHTHSNISHTYIQQIF